MLRFFTTFVAALVGMLLVLPLLAVIIPIWIFNALVNAINGFLTKSVTPWEEIIQFEPEIGWKVRPDLNTTYSDRIGDIGSIQTDGEGWPGTHTIEESDIVVFGDSFAFGYGVPGERAFHVLIPGCRTKTIAAPGYSMVQELMWMKRYGSRLRGKHVVWFLCIENDLAENLKPYIPPVYPTPFLRRKSGADDWELVCEHVQPNRWRCGDEGVPNGTLFAHICTPCEYSARVFSAARHLIREGKGVCDAVGADLVVMSIPYKLQLNEEGLRLLRKLLKNPASFRSDYPDQQLAAICGELEVPFIAGGAHFTIDDYKRYDGHWNFRGNEKVAQLIGQSRVKERKPRAEHAPAGV